MDPAKVGRAEPRHRVATSGGTTHEDQASGDAAPADAASRQALADLARVLDLMCPMHLLVSPAGEILHVGPTLARLRPATPLTGTRFMDVFQVNRPRRIGGFQDLLEAPGRVLRLSFRDQPATAFKGCLAPGQAAHVVNLSFGISVLDALRDYALTSADFAATDMTIELLYLVEAKSAAMEESRKLNLRLRGAMVAAEAQALTDTLTGLANRRALDHRMDRLLRGRDGFALMHLDLDRFKAVNDTLGHAAGDHVLRHVAAILTEETRSADTVARIGGDEFVLLFPGLGDRELLDSLALRIIRRLTRPIAYGDAICRISGSIGTVLSDDYDRPDMSRMMSDADEALYRSKRAGRGCHRFHRS